MLTVVGGHKVYGLRMDPPSGYRNNTPTALCDEISSHRALCSLTRRNPPYMYP